jgi:hypothetical protein
MLSSMRKKWLEVLVATAVALAPGIIVAAPAVADTPGCVTKAEFGAVAKGWSMKRVHNKFDTRGKQTWYMSGSKYFPAEQSREYRACVHPTWSSVNVDYAKKSGVWRVTSKYAYWG